MSGRDVRVRGTVREASRPLQAGWSLLSDLIFTIGRAWRWWGSLAVLGALLFGTQAAIQPPTYVSEGTLTLTPRLLLEGYLLATQDLTRHYAARLSATERVQRVMREAGTATPPIVTAEGRPGMAISLRVLHPEPELAERIARTLMIDLRDNIQSENRARVEADRLNAEVSLTSFPRPATDPWWRHAGTGAVTGGVFGVISALFHAWMARGRLETEGDTRRSIAVPVLGVIPRHSPQ